MKLTVLGVVLTAIIVCAPGASTAWAAEDEEKKSEDAVPVPEARTFVTRHSGRFGGRAVRYTATAGETYLRNEKGEPVASIFSTAYLENEVRDPTTRPVTFVFNGGPGSPAVWLHMGVFGPRVVQVPSDAGDDGAPPYPLIDNALSMLDLTDLVFVDPVGTGFSRVIGEGKTEDYWGLKEDARSIAEFIRVWLTANKRWNSPRFIAGESFGTTRAVGVVHELGGGAVVIAFNGLILISQALDFTGSTPVHDNLIAYVTYFPSLAATAWYHGKVQDAPTDLAVFLDEARDFAVGEYMPALFQGSLLGAEERARVVARMAHFTGLSEAYIDVSNLRVLTPRFRKQLLRDEGVAVGALDGRYKGDDVDDAAERPDGDPASYGVGSAFSAALNHYFATELNVDLERPYRIRNRKLSRNWRYRTAPDGESYEPAYVNVARQLATAMRRNKDLRVLVASGYYDLVTPFFDAEYTFGRHGIDMERTEMTYYESGHMMYLHRPSFEKLVRDIRGFITNSLGGGAKP